LRQEITLENLFVLFIFCKPTVNFDGNGNGTPVITYKSTAHLSYISTFEHVFRNKLYMKVGDCL